MTGAEPTFSSVGSAWSLAGATFASEPDDPALEIPGSALRDVVPEASEPHFRVLQAGFSPSGPVEPLAAAPVKSLGGWRRWNLSLVASCAFHAAVAATFLHAMNEEALMEGSDFSGIAYLGDSVDQLKAGEISETQEPAVNVTLVTVMDALPIETVHAEAVPTETVPTESVEAVAVARAETPPVETVKRVAEQAAEPVEPETQGQAAPDLLTPDVLASDRAEGVDDNVVQKPSEGIAEQPPEPAQEQVAQASKPDPKPVETAKPKQEKKKQAAKKTDEGRKIAEKAQAKSRKSGSGGQNETDSRRGQADGREDGDNRQASRGGSRNGKTGNAAVSNYPGKVRAKLSRAARKLRAKGRGEVLVAFAVGTGGNVKSVRIARSSGVASVDEAALSAVRKAAPFPPIPDDAGRSSWEFSVPLAFAR